MADGHIYCLYDNIPRIPSKENEAVRMNDIRFVPYYEQENADLRHQLHECLNALNELLNLYVSLANSGDAGFWNPEKELEVINARRCLAINKMRCK